MTRKTHLLIGSLIVSLTSGCSWFDQSSEFERVPPGRQLEVPPDLDAPNDRAALRVPNTTYSRVSGGPVANRSQAGSGLPDVDGSRFLFLDGEATLVVADSVASTYRRLGVALERVGLKVVEQSENDTSFEVEYTDTQARANRPGVFSRWILRRKGPTDHSGMYRIRIGSIDQQSVVTMHTDAGDEAPVKVSEEILKALEARLG